MIKERQLLDVSKPYMSISLDIKTIVGFFILIIKVYISEKGRVTSRTPRTSYLEKLLSKKND